MRQPRRRSLAAACLLAAALGCGESATEPVTVTGTYHLTRVDGIPGPARIPGGVDGAPARLTAGTVSLRDAGVWSAEIVLLVVRQDGPATLSSRMGGTYSVSRDTVRLRDAIDGSVVVGVVRSSRLTVASNGLVLDFDR